MEEKDFKENEDTLENAAKKVAKMIVEDSKPLDPELLDIIEEDFWDLI